MKKGSLSIFILFHVILFTSLNAQEQTDFNSYWDRGFHVKSKDGQFSLQFGGRLHHHVSLFSSDPEIDQMFGKYSGGSEFRRVRFYNQGTIYKYIGYKLEVDFTGGPTTIKDIFVSLNEIPVIGKITIGHFKEPFGLDQLNSSNDMTFIERASNFDITPGRNNGILISNTALKDHRATWAIGFFKETDNFGKSLNTKNVNFTGRISGLPYFKGKNQLLHLGLAYSYRRKDQGDYNLKSIPEAHLLPFFIQTGLIENVDKVQLLGAEFALVHHAFSMQGEYIQSRVKSTPEQFDFSGYYMEVSYFLTGESRNYSTKTGFFKRVSQKSTFNPIEKGTGAFELSARYASTDFSDKTVNGGIEKTLTAGLNWHLNPGSKFGVNYSHALLESVGNSNIFQMKFQVAF